MNSPLRMDVNSRQYGNLKPDLNHILMSPNVNNKSDSNSNNSKAYTNAMKAL